MNLLFASLISVLFATSALADCGPKDEVLGFYKANGSTIRMEGVTGNGLDMVIVTNVDDTYFTIILIDPMDDIACVMESGVEFKIIPKPNV